MPTLMGVSVDVDVFDVDSMSSSYFDPESMSIVLSKNALKVAISGRTRKWTLDHELAHAVLHVYNRKLKRKLESVFGDLSEDAYEADGWDEFRSKLLGYDTDEYVTARATLCPEEDFAETCAYLSDAKGKIDPDLPEAVREKLAVVKQCFSELKQKVKKPKRKVKRKSR